MKSRRALGAFGLLAIMCWAASCRAPETPATERPLTTQQIVQLAKPAVVMVQTTHTARASFPRSVRFREQRVIQAVRRFLISRGIVYEWEIEQRRYELMGFLLEDILANLSEYIIPVSTEEKTYEFTSVGSGFFVSADGYVVTCAHVVAPDAKELRQWALEQFLASEIDTRAQQEAEIFALQLEQAGYSLAGDQIERLRGELAKFLRRHASIKQVEVGTPRVLLGSRVGEVVSVKPLTAEVVVKGGAIPKKDVAVLKVSGENFLTIPLSDATRLEQGDTVFAIGYPIAETLMRTFEESSAQEPTLTQGVCSARRTLKEGWEAVQIDADVKPGSSGGPIVNNQGQVVGIAAFRVKEPTGQGAANFIVPISIVREFLQRANVSMKDGLATPIYREALDAIEREDFQTALEKLNQVEALRPGIPAVQELRAAAQQAVLEGRGRKQTPAQWVWAAVGVVGGVLAVLGVVIVARKRAGARRVQVQSAPQAVGAGDAPTQLASDVMPTQLRSAPYYLVGLQGALAGQRVPVPPSGLTIGRASDCDLTINEPLVSRLHARLTIEAGQLVIYDLNSTNGTTVNGVKVQRHALKAGDIVEIGNTQLQVSIGA